MKAATFALAACLAVGPWGAATADDLLTTPQVSAAGVTFQLHGAYSKLTLSIAGPNGFYASGFGESRAPAIDLQRLGPLEDGVYTWQLTAATNEKIKLRTPIADGRGGAPRTELRKGVAASGTFLIKGGTIVKPGPAQERKGG
jgi:hypothetical protein